MTLKPIDIIASNIYFNINMVNYIIAKNKMLYDITESNTELQNADLHHEYHCTIDLQFDWFGNICMTTPRAYQSLPGPTTACQGLPGLTWPYLVLSGPT